ncbi:unnamed protein product [Linum trigynum]|uniref:Uncharacterized protein n=1 Tax=Linum trigynum TaxID=586398 RepID=A0AAV2GH00_9ROSI
MVAWDENGGEIPSAVGSVALLSVFSLPHDPSHTSGSHRKPRRGTRQNSGEDPGGGFFRITKNHDARSSSASRKRMLTTEKKQILSILN